VWAKGLDETQPTATPAEGPIQWISSETLLTLSEHLSRPGWANADVDAVLAGNFRRVAQNAWRA
jgi:membrane dipeptidase